MTRFIDNSWERTFHNAATGASIDIACPFVTEGARRWLYKALESGNHLRLLTRFSLEDAVQGVQDFSLLADLAASGAEIRGICNLHAKVWLFDNTKAIVGSTNLTGAAFNRNLEAAILTEDTQALCDVRTWFDALWNSAALAEELMLREWHKQICEARLIRGKAPDSLPDKGGMPSTALDPTGYSNRAFVKFQGMSNNRSPITRSTRIDIDESIHRYVWYPRKRRTKAVKDGDIIFIGRLISDPRSGEDDTRIFGRAKASAYKEGRDDANDTDNANGECTKFFSRCIRLHDAEIIKGTMADGVSLATMMDELDYQSYRPTLENHRRKLGNLNPRKAYMQAPSVHLSEYGHAWLDRAFDRAAARAGIFSSRELDAAGWAKAD